MLPVLFAALLQATVPAMRPIDRGTQSGIDRARQVVVRSAADWAALWRAHAPGRPQPPVDFAREMVVGVFLGSRPTAGYGVDITGTRQDGDAVVVEYRVTAPPPDAITAQVITSPYVLVALPAARGEVKFVKTD